MSFLPLLESNLFYLSYFSWGIIQHTNQNLHPSSIIIILFLPIESSNMLPDTQGKKKLTKTLWLLTIQFKELTTR